MYTTSRARVAELSSNNNIIVNDITLNSATKQTLGMNVVSMDNTVVARPKMHCYGHVTHGTSQLHYLV